MPSPLENISARALTVNDPLAHRTCITSFSRGLQRTLDTSISEMFYPHCRTKMSPRKHHEDEHVRPFFEGLKASSPLENMRVRTLIVSDTSVHRACVTSFSRVLQCTPGISTFESHSRCQTKMSLPERHENEHVRPFFESLKNPSPLENMRVRTLIMSDPSVHRACVTPFSRVLQCTLDTSIFEIFFTPSVERKCPLENAAKMNMSGRSLKVSRAPHHSKICRRGWGSWDFQEAAGNFHFGSAFERTAILVG